MAWSESICSRATAAPFAVPGHGAVAGAGLGGWLPVAEARESWQGGCPWQRRASLGRAAVVAEPRGSWQRAASASKRSTCWVS
jgi:hypothetical protein